MAGNIQDLLDEDAPIQNVESADTAIFYSISNAQIGLSGINFGNFLIKRVVDSLRTELRGIRTFATLSPIPGFMPWLRRRLREKDFNFLTREQEENLVSLSSKSVNQTANEALSRYFCFGPNGTTERTFNQRSIPFSSSWQLTISSMRNALAEPPLILWHIFISITDLGSSNYIGMLIPRLEGSSSPQGSC